MPEAHNADNAAKEPNHASNAGTRLAGAIMPNKAPTPHSKKTKASGNPMVLMAFPLLNQSNIRLCTWHHF
jgi:hypothetical protein